MQTDTEPLKTSRCACERCGAHSECTKGKATVGGRCSVCGSASMRAVGE